MADIKTVINERHEEIIKKIDEYNTALKENDFAKATRFEQELKDAEAAYAEAKTAEVFGELKGKENPVREAITMYSFPVTSHKVIREEGVTKGFEVVEDKERQIDLVKFFKYCGLKTDWTHKVERFNQLLTLRAANELKMTKAQLKKICDSYYMSDLARQVDLGGTPDSNTAICKQLQSIFDDILFEDNGKGKNKYKVNNHDVAYLLMCYTKRSSKRKLTVAVAKTSFVHRLIADIMHRVVTGKAYDLDYKMVKVSQPEAKATKTIEAATPAEEATAKVSKPQTKANKKAEVSELETEAEIVIVKKSA